MKKKCTKFYSSATYEHNGLILFLFLFFFTAEEHQSHNPRLVHYLNRHSSTILHRFREYQKSVSASHSIHGTLQLIHFFLFGILPSSFLFKGLQIVVSSLIVIWSNVLFVSKTAFAFATFSLYNNSSFFIFSFIFLFFSLRFSLWISNTVLPSRSSPALKMIPAERAFDFFIWSLRIFPLSMFSFILLWAFEAFLGLESIEDRIQTYRLRSSGCLEDCCV